MGVSKQTLAISACTRPGAVGKASDGARDGEPALGAPLTLDMHDFELHMQAV